MTADTHASTFQELWPQGFVEGWVHYGGDFTDVILDKFVAPHSGGDKTVLEIGPGGGLFTAKLGRLFSKVMAIDVVEKSPQFPTGTNITYIKAPDRDFTCHSIPPTSVDFVFSFGVFPHLTRAAQSEYLVSMFRVLKPGGQAVVSFANWKRHPLLMRIQINVFLIDSAEIAHLGGEHVKAVKEPVENSAPWFYNDLDHTKRMVKSAGFIDFTDLIPEFRDTLGGFKRPMSSPMPSS